MSIGQELLNVPMGDMIRQMAMAIADAQFALDRSSIMVAEMMGGQRLLRDDEGNLVDYDGQPLSALRDEDGNPVYNENGELTYAEGYGPRVIDSRVQFGYSYEPASDTTPWENGAAKVVRKPKMVSMMELGFTPTFYQFVDTLIEVKITIKMTREVERTAHTTSTDTTTTKANVQSQKVSSWSGRGRGAGSRSKSKGTVDQVVVSSVDGTYSSKYSYSAEGASVLRTKLVPVPPPGILEERIRDLMETEREYARRAAEGKAGVLEYTQEDSKKVIVQKFSARAAPAGGGGS